MNTINNAAPRLISDKFEFSSELRSLNKEVNSGTFNVQFAAMKLSMLMIGANQDRLSTQMQESAGNLNKLTAMNQLKADATSLKAARSNNKIKDDETMEKYAADTQAFATKAKGAGIEMSADEEAKFASGKITSADIDAIEARIKTQQDSASNQSQADQMNMQKLNTLISQFTNMGMTFLDEYKKGVDRILR